MFFRKFVQTAVSKIDNFRHSLAYIDALPQLTALGAIVGFCTGLIIIVFRYSISAPLSLLLPEHSENFEALSATQRTLLIFSGCFIVAIIYQLAGKRNSETSIAHVLDRTHNHQAKLPMRNWLLQFFGGITALSTGQSVGREGPAVHLGAGVASQLGQWLRLPNNSMQTLVGCGVAAAISAAFDTPMAGVIFAMEVILLEYTIVGFVPVILSSVIGAAMSQAVFGPETNFSTAHSDITSLVELPYMLVVGLIIALCSAIYIRLNIFAMSLASWHITLRLFIAASLTSLVASQYPEVMGLGYDTANLAIKGELAFNSLLLIALMKLVLTPVVVGLGVPGGVIGPLLVSGACLGGALGVIASLVYPNIAIGLEIYVILGMTGMMAATLNAPLAALVAVLELSYNPHMIFPAMLVIVVSCLFTRHVFKLDSIFVEQLRSKGRSLTSAPADRALKKAGVISIMDTRFQNTPAMLNYDEAKALLANNPSWIIIEDDEKKTALAASDLAAYLDTAPEDVLSLEQEIELEEIPGRRDTLVPIHETATLLEALHACSNTGARALYVATQRNPIKSDIAGIVLQTSIENYYQPEEFKRVVD